MMRFDRPKRPRGASPRGDFEVAKSFASRTEDQRVAADRLKTTALREARLKKQFPPAQGLVKAFVEGMEKP
jgi:hypothetical protein